MSPSPADLLAATVRPPAERMCAACGYEVVQFRPLPHCPMCGALPDAGWLSRAAAAEPAIAAA